MSHLTPKRVCFSHFDGTSPPVTLNAAVSSCVSYDVIGLPLLHHSGDSLCMRPVPYYTNGLKSLLPWPYSLSFTVPHRLPELARASPSFYSLTQETLSVVTNPVYVNIQSLRYIFCSPHSMAAPLRHSYLPSPSRLDCFFQGFLSSISAQCCVLDLTSLEVTHSWLLWWPPYLCFWQVLTHVSVCKGTHECV